MRIIHCEVCDICVKEYDHHCPWTGKCIGSGNIFWFHAFAIMIPVYCVSYLFIVII